MYRRKHVRFYSSELDSDIACAAHQFNFISPSDGNCELRHDLAKNTSSKLDDETSLTISVCVLRVPHKIRYFGSKTMTRDERENARERCRRFAGTTENSRPTCASDARNGEPYVEWVYCRTCPDPISFYRPSTADSRRDERTRSNRE